MSKEIEYKKFLVEFVQIAVKEMHEASKQNPKIKTLEVNTFVVPKADPSLMPENPS